jgi:hypothetical protein
MRSIERRFIRVQKRKTYTSSFICFSIAIRGQGFSADRIKRKFNELVDKNDYIPEEKNTLFKYLYLLTKDSSRRTSFGHKTALQDEIYFYYDTLLITR